jgi:hypothetical protein
MKPLKKVKFISMGAKCVVLVTKKSCYMWMDTHM